MSWVKRMISASLGAGIAVLTWSRQNRPTERGFWTPVGLQRPGWGGPGLCKSLRNLVGLAGFEPTTSCTPSKRASQAAPQPESTSLHAPARCRCPKNCPIQDFLKRDLFPIQDDPEKDSKGTIGGVGILRLNALTEVQIGEFLRGSRAIGFEGQSRAEIYAVVQESLVRQEYFRQSKKQRGAIRAYLSRLTGRSLPQMTRLIRQQKANGEIRAAERTRRRFATRYTDTDVGLLAEVDRAHQRLNGPSTRRILQRALT